MKHPWWAYVPRTFGIGLISGGVGRLLVNGQCRTAFAMGLAAVALSGVLYYLEQAEGGGP